MNVRLMIAEQWVAGWWLGVAGHCSVGIWLCFDGFVEGCCKWSSVSGCWSSEHGLVKGLSWCLLALEMGVGCQCVWVDILSCVAVGSALGLYHVALCCCCWSFDGTFNVSMEFCRAEEKYWLARVEHRQWLGIVSSIMVLFLYCFSGNELISDLFKI